jgi:hypothetical protein
VIGPARIRRLAAESGYREEIVEKVLYLSAILRQLARHPDLEGAWALKGGTALNLFFLDVPRLSVDETSNAGTGRSGGPPARRSRSPRP